MFHKEQRVQAHPATDAFMQGDRYGVVATIGRKYVHVRMDSGRVRKFTPDLIRPVERRTAPTPPDHCVGRKCWYIGLDGRKVACVVESIDSERHPSRLNLRVTAIKDRLYRKGHLINTPPAFVQPR